MADNNDDYNKNVIVIERKVQRLKWLGYFYTCWAAIYWVWAIVNTIAIFPNGFDFGCLSFLTVLLTMIVLFRYVIPKVQADEKVFQGDSLANSTANGVVIDFLNNNRLRLNQLSGEFVSNSTVNSITGVTSGATAVIVSNGVANADMKPYSGDILYIENRTNVTRATNQIEDFKIVLEF